MENLVFEKVLFVGIDYRIPKGGIASVLNTYSTFIHPFKFVRTAASELNSVQKLLFAVSGYICLLWKLLFDRKIKIVHIHSASGTSFWRKSYVIKISQVLGKKIIFHCHGGGFKDFHEKYSSKVDTILAKVDVVVCLSEEWKHYFESIGCINVVTINNVIEEPQIQSFNKGNLVHFLFLGLICDNKGVFDILKVLSYHKQELTGKILLHVGGNGQTDRLVSTIKDLHIEQLVQFEGWVDKEKKQRLLNLADVYILPSYIEGVPISILEAESYHKPVITTNVGGIPSIVKDRETGLIITPGDMDELFCAIKILANDKNLRQKYGEAGYMISIKYLPEIINKELTILYQRMLEDA